MPDLEGFMFPRSATGRSSLVPPPPWHYSGQMLTIEYRTDPATVAELLPAPLAPADDDPGAVAIVWADWQSCSDTFDEADETFNVTLATPTNATIAKASGIGTIVNDD